jgi:hypothetical protein
MRFDGTTHPRKAVELKIGYLSAVDMPAHEGAQVTILKARMTTKEPDAMQPVLKTIFSQALAEKQYEKVVDEMLCQAWEMSLNSALRESAEEIAKDPNLDEPGKQAALRAAVDEYIVRLHSAMVGTPVTKTHEDTAKQEADMADEQTQAELAKYKALSELSDVQKAHYATLSEAEQVEFLKGKREVPADESFTDVDGAVISKSAVGSAAYQVMKAQNARLAKMQDDLDMQTLTKRAEAELKHLPGEVVAKARVLKAIDKMPEAERATLDQILKAADAAAAPGFKPAAVAGEESTDPADKLEKMAKQHAADNKVSYSAAYTAVLATDEGKALYKEMQ